MADDFIALGSDGVTEHTFKAKDLGTKKLPGKVLYDEAGAEVIGLVTASPGATTVLGRLKSAVDALTTLDGRVDGLETLIGTTNSALTTIDGRVDGIEGLLTTHSGYLDGLETAIAATNTKLDTMIAAIVPVGGANAAASVPVVTASDDAIAIAIRDAVRGLVDDAAFGVASSYIKPMGFLADEGSTDSVDEGDAGAARITLDRKQIVTIQPHTAGGLSIFRSLDLDETEEEIKATAGCLYKLRITNRAATARYIKLYNATAANVTVGTTTPVDTIVVPGASSADLATVLTENFGGLGMEFGTALCIAATTGLADNDTGAPGANDVVVTAYYK